MRMTEQRVLYAEVTYTTHNIQTIFYKINQNLAEFKQTILLQVKRVHHFFGFQPKKQ